MKKENGEEKYTFNEIATRFNLYDDDGLIPVNEKDRMFANPMDMAKIGAVIMRLENRVAFLERKLNKRRNRNTGYSEATLEYPNGKKKRKSNKGLTPGFKRPVEWKKPGQYKRK